jgi:hypothetical protein
MKIKKINISSITGVANATSDTYSQFTAPFENEIIIQLDCSAAFTGTAQVQGRSHPSQNWYNIGAQVVNPATQQRLLRNPAPEMRVFLDRTSGTGIVSFNIWMGR